jgi:DNA polymerase III subunit delta
MKLSPRDAPGYFRKPDPNGTGILIFGADAMRVALRRQEVIAGLIGPEGEAEMRLTRMSGAELRKDPALLSDAVRAQSFFPGTRVAFVDEATDGLAPVIGAALDDWQKGDAQIIVTAGSLTAKSALRKAFEGHKTALCLGLYDEPPSREEVQAMIAQAGLTGISADADTALMALSRSLDPGDFRQTVEKLGLYMYRSAEKVSAEDVLACAPQSAEAEIDTLLAVVAGGKAEGIADVLRRLYAQGTLPVALCIGAMRHFRTLHVAACDPEGPASAFNRMRPPVFGPRRDAMAGQARLWGRDRLESALELLIETDLQLRSSSHAPAQALVERALIRLAMMARNAAR